VIGLRPSGRVRPRPSFLALAAAAVLALPGPAGAQQDVRVGIAGYVDEKINIAIDDVTPGTEAARTVAEILAFDLEFSLRFNVLEGRATAGVEGVRPGEWVVTVGQHLLHQELESEGAEAAPDRARGEAGVRARASGQVHAQIQARLRPTTWERVLELQGLQREDLLQDFLEKQRRVARALGAEIPDDPELVERTLRELDGAEPPGEPPTDGAAGEGFGEGG